MGCTCLNLALIILLCAYMVYLIGGKSNFVSERAKNIASESAKVFDAYGDDTTFSKFKHKLSGAGEYTDAVEYNDIRKLWKDGSLTPDNVDSVL